MHAIRLIIPFTLASLALASLAAAGCDKDDDAGAKAGASKQVEQPATSAIDLDAVHAAVPAELKQNFKFEVATIDDELKAVVPAGWEASEYIPGSYSPPPNSNLGFFTKYRLGSNCDGACQPKDWDAVVAKVDFGQLEGTEIVKDEKLDDGRLVVARDGDRVRVIAAWWKPGASQYFSCRAELDGKATAAVDAFEQACRQTRVIAW